MKSTLFTHVGVCLLGMGLLTSTQVSAAPTVSSLPDYQKQLTSPDSGTRQQATQNILQNQLLLGQMLQNTAEKSLSAVNKVINAPRDKPNKVANASEGIQNDQLIAASTINLLGNLRVETSIPFLVKNLLFLDVSQGDRAPLEKRFPCYGSLVKIGLPALEPLVQQAARTDRISYQRVSVSLLVQALGLKMTDVYLQEQMSKQTSPDGRNRIQAMSDFLKTLRREQVVK